MEKKLLSPKLDVVFQALFGEQGSERITKKFLETIIDEKITQIDLSKNPILRREFKEDKLGILDVLVQINQKEQCNIEMQVVDKKNIIDRILYYWSKLYTKEIKIGQDYIESSKTVVILIADFEIKGLEETEYISKWKIMEPVKQIILTKKFEIDIIELPKIKGKEQEQGELLDWLYFLINPKSERVKKVMKENKAIEEAVEKLNKISADEKMQKIAELREKAIMDEKAVYAKGIDDGIKKGLKEGKAIGKKENSIEIAKKMKDEKIDIEVISKITGLSKEEIEKL